MMHRAVFRMLATAWLLGIANPQSIKRLGHFLTADCKSAGTPNGGRAYPALLVTYPPGRLTGDGHIQRYGKSAGTPNGGRAYPALWILYFRNQDITQFPLPDCPSC